MSVSNFLRNDVGLPSDIIWTDVTGIKFDPRQVPTFTAFARGVCIFGANFGDEGKGKEVDSKAMEYKRLGYKVLSARGQGSGNAGHTVKVDGKSYDFHYLTSAGLLADLMLLGPGMLIDPIRVLKEMEKLPEKQRETVVVAERATISTNFERYVDAWGDAKLRDADCEAIGTTGSGVGPGVAFRGFRYHVTFADALMCKSIEELRTKFLRKPVIPEELYKKAEEIYSDAYLQELWDAIHNLNIVDSVEVIQKCRAEGNWAVILEVSQAVGLDPLFGNGGHMVTSTPTIPPGAIAGSGLTSYDFPDGSIAMAKAYTSKVGGGCFITKFTPEEAAIENMIRKMTGGEKGVTTGRPRGLGWHDGPLTRHTVKLTNGEVVVNCMDVIAALNQVTDHVKICFAYQNIHTGEVTYNWPYNLYDYKPLYVTLPIKGKSPEQVVREYILLFEAVIGKKIYKYGVGPGRGQYHLREDAFK